MRRITDHSSPARYWLVADVGPPDGWPLASRLSCIQEQSHCPVPSAQHSADSSQIRSSKYDIHHHCRHSQQGLYRLKCPHITWWQSICSLFLHDCSHYSYTIRLSSWFANSKGLINFSVSCWLGEFDTETIFETGHWINSSLNMFWHYRRKLEGRWNQSSQANDDP